jgi:hypothetical protein
VEIVPGTPQLAASGSGGINRPDDLLVRPSVELSDDRRQEP